MTADQFNRIAARIARLATTAATRAEANHWWAESGRFENLADLARADPDEARRRYQPTRHYKPQVA